MSIFFFLSIETYPEHHKPQSLIVRLVDHSLFPKLYTQETTKYWESQNCNLT